MKISVLVLIITLIVFLALTVSPLFMRVKYEKVNQRSSNDCSSSISDI